MILLVKNNTELINFLPISESDFDFDRIKPFIEQAQRKYLIPLVSTEEFDRLTNEGDKQELYAILSSAAVNFAMHLGFTQLNNFVTNAGVFQSDPKSEAKGLNWADRKDHQRSYLQAGFSALDQALLEMESKKTVFNKWVDSNAYTLFDETFCRSTADFNRFQSINNSPQTFLKLRPYMREVWQQYFAQWLSAETIKKIKADPKVLAVAQQAEAAFTIMKAIQQDGFIADHTGVQVVFELLPWEKLQLPSEDSIYRKTEHKRNQGDEAIKLLEQLLIDGDFDYTKKEIEPTTHIKKYKSGLGL